MMNRQQNQAGTGRTRREFLQRTTLGVAGTVALAKVPLVHAGAGDAEMEVRIGLVGCGGRGTGAVLNALGAATKVIYPATGYHTEDVGEGASIERPNITVAALADLFPDRLQRCQDQLAQIGINVPKGRCFTGFEGYQQLLTVPEVNYVILATPPHFRPLHLRAAVDAGKHVFMEKPAAVDVPGVRAIMDAGELAREKGLGIAAGTPFRHARSYRETIRRIHDGALGDIIHAKCYWNGGEIWVIDRQPGWSDMEWQLRNWPYFTWLSGDHIVEQHLHNLDVINWALGAHPIRVVSSLGGRQVRTGSRYGNIFDHFSVEYEYPNGVSVFSQCRQTNGCANLVGETVVGTHGTSNCKNRIKPKKGKPWRFRQQPEDEYQVEHEHLIASIRAGEPINEAQALAESTMTGIIGREAVYSGQPIEWDAAMKSTTRLGPAAYEMGPCPTPEVAMPGTYRFR